MLVVSSVEAAPDSTPRFQSARTIVWSDDQSIYEVETIPAGTILVVNPGDTVKFGRDGKLVIYGRIEATNALFTFEQINKPWFPGKPLTPEQKACNQQLARRRVRIEHVKASVKLCRIVKDACRLRLIGVRMPS
jgi:hypothetical protein